MTKGIKESQAPRDDPLDPLDYLVATEPLLASQGDQEAQGDQVMGDEPLTVAHNNRCPCERCIHNLSSDGWLKDRDGSVGQPYAEDDGVDHDEYDPRPNGGLDAEKGDDDGEQVDGRYS
jgi:hypothetical protein